METIYCENRACERYNTYGRWWKLCWSLPGDTIEYFDPIFCEETFKRRSKAMRNSSRWRKIEIRGACQLKTIAPGPMVPVSRATAGGTWPQAPAPVQMKRVRPLKVVKGWQKKT